MHYGDHLSNGIKEIVKQVTERPLLPPGLTASSSKKDLLHPLPEQPCDLEGQGTGSNLPVSIAVTA
jgi:hypothetical protein